MTTIAKKTKSTLILGIESSCDETAAAVVADGRTILSNVIASQAKLHQQYGGVVPEIASRKHVEAILPVIDQALKEAQIELSDLSAIAVTQGPGLVGALLVGLSAAKGLSWMSNIPLLAVHHLAGHIAANYLCDPDLKPPFLCLVVSGAHSHIIWVREDLQFDVLAKTRDDAAGEAFDKIARVIGLGYPGGPKIDKAAQDGNPRALSLPQTTFPDSLDFSFSGVKTAAINELNRLKQKASLQDQSWQDLVSLSDFAASFQQAIVDVLSDHALAAAKQHGAKRLVLAGGVAANRCLRRTLQERAAAAQIKLSLPPIELCTDNAAMIAAAGFPLWQKGQVAGLDLNAKPSLGLSDLAK